MPLRYHPEPKPEDFPETNILRQLYGSPHGWLYTLRNLARDHDSLLVVVHPNFDTLANYSVATPEQKEAYRDGLRRAVTLAQENDIPVVHFREIYASMEKFGKPEDRLDALGVSAGHEVPTYYAQGIPIQVTQTNPFKTVYLAGCYFGDGCIDASFTSASAYFRGFGTDRWTDRAENIFAIKDAVLPYDPKSSLYVKGPLRFGLEFLNLSDFEDYLRRQLDATGASGVKIVREIDPEIMTNQILMRGQQQLARLGIRSEVHGYRLFVPVSDSTYYIGEVNPNSSIGLVENWTLSVDGKEKTALGREEGEHEPAQYFGFDPSKDPIQNDGGSGISHIARMVHMVGIIPGNQPYQPFVEELKRLQTELG